MLNHMGFSCWISSNDTPLQIYGGESVGRERSAWIASEAGKSFAVHWQDKSGKRIATSGHVFIDGKDVASAIIRPGRSTPVKRAGAKMRRNKIKPFVFSELRLTDDETLASPYDASLRDVGTIRVEITRVRLGAEVPFAGYEAENHGLVHEQAKKAGAHCTKFGDAKRVEKARTVSISTAPYDPNQPGPYVTFEFRYRSLEMLKATGIVQTSRKRSNKSPDNDQVIEIYSSEDEASSPTLHPSSPRSASSESPSKKRVKTEPQEDKLLLESLPASSPPADTHTEPEEHTGSLHPPSSSLPDATQTSEQSQSPTPNKPKETTVHVKQEEEDDDDEEFDMLPGESEATLSTDPSQDVDSLLFDLPPPSSSPGPEGLTTEDNDEDDS